MTTALATKKIDAALADAQHRNIVFRTAINFWNNLQDPRLPKAGKVTFLVTTLVTWAAYFVCPLDAIPDFLAVFLGPLFFLVLIDDLLLVPILGVSLFNWWADWFRRRHPSA